MEVKPGYKRTDAGVIPEDWHAICLSVIASEVGDGIHATPIYSSTGDYYFINGNNIRDGRIVVTEETKRVGHSEFKRHRKALSRSSILMSINGTIGNLGLYADEAVILGKSAAYLNVKDDVARLFVYYSLQTELVKRQFSDGLTGTTIQNLGLSTIRNTEIPLPPTKAEQEAIAEALSDADALIESLEQLVAKKRQIKRGAMQELLTGKRRLPGFSAEWTAKRFGDIAQPRTERADPGRSRRLDFCIELEHIEQGTGCLVGSTTTSESSSLKSMFRENDILFGKLRAYLRKYWRATREGVCSTEIWVLATKDGQVTPDYLFQIVKVDSFIEAASTAYGTHMPRSDWNVVRNYELSLPSPPEQAAIAAILSDMDTEIAALEAKLAKARQLKQGMMQELLTGRIRLV